MNGEIIIILIGIVLCIMFLISMEGKKKMKQYDIKNIHGTFYVYENNVVIAVCKTEEEADNVIIKRLKKKRSEKSLL